MRECEGVQTVGDGCVDLFELCLLLFLFLACCAVLMLPELGCCTLLANPADNHADSLLGR